jgi:hypothetical protein
MTELWDPTGPGVLRLPSGRLIRGRGLRRPLPPGPTPTFAVYLLATGPPDVAWDSRWLRWRDFWHPHAVETPWQRRFVTRFNTPRPGR